jgi:hypothetical protein
MPAGPPGSLHAKRSFFQTNFNKIWDVSGDFSRAAKYKNLMTTRSTILELLHADRQGETHKFTLQLFVGNVTKSTTNTTKFLKFCGTNT